MTRHSEFPQRESDTGRKAGAPGDLHAVRARQRSSRGPHRLVLGLALAAALSSSALAARSASPGATTIIPDHFLRRWDPLTVFFARDLGPAQGGPEDQAQRFVTLHPAHPGAFRWLDRRTLQFQPAEPWPALASFAVKAEAATATLVTLMAAPIETVPADKAEGLASVDEVTLTFPEPLDAKALARMVSIELRPLPGVGGAATRVLTGRDFEVKAVERTAGQERATYVLILREPIPLGTRAVVRLRLALADKEEQAFKEIAFATAEPFRVVSMGCRAKQYPVTPEGTRYSRDQAVDCGADARAVVVDFSSTPKAIDPVQARNLVRFTPAVDKLNVALEGKTLTISGDFARDMLYGLRLVPTAIEDQSGRRLELRGTSEVFVHFPRKTAYVRWGASHGIVERLGPQMLPVEGRGQERVDVRIHKVDALDRAFWPFPDRPVVIDESQRPPGPGETPPPPAPLDPPPSATALARYIQTLGSPPVSSLLTLPLRRDGGAATFGLDVAPHLARIAGSGQPGTYLVGLRDLAAGSQRSWMRVQVTDLALSTLEEPDAVRYTVTSLSTGQPVRGATVRVEGIVSEPDHRDEWTALAEGTTNAEGAFEWPAIGSDHPRSRSVRRISVELGADRLVMDPARPPERYADNQWSRERGTWLQWAFEPLGGRGPQVERLCHLFTERPVYRPDEDVHIKGYLRERERGHLKPITMQGWVIVEGPGGLAWRYPVTLTAAGSFYHKFHEENLPTGTYTVHLEGQDRRERHGGASFQIEAYRVPRFEIALHGPEQASLDKAFEVSLTATYYAGGKVSGQPVQWRVTQFPYAWTPKKREGFSYSSDARFSGAERFESTPRLEKQDATNESGSAALGLDPTVEPTAQPRSYVIEATVTGPDDQTVTATRSIPALPPFVLGVKAPRFLERAKQIVPEILVAGSDGELVAGVEVSVRLLRREWHSHLRASDFSDGVARYMTDVVDQKILEKKVTSAAQPVPVPFLIDKAGVYVVELEARDRLQRAQVVSVDLYAGGEGPIAWPKPVTQVFSVGTDKARYDPGMTAAVVLKSPFQTARALAIVEAPEGNRYEWITVTGGAATYRVPILGTFTPRVPVHFILMRGRLPGTSPSPGNSLDLGKPATLAATSWLEVAPLANQVGVALAYPERAQPGQKVDVTITLKDPQGKPLPGEVTLWLVDQAVLALGKERRLDPLPDFITPVRSHLTAHDTRNLAFGALPFADNPGGDEGAEESGLLDRVTVRKNFKSVPYYNPAIMVGPEGKAVVTVELSDDLTNFKLRAKAASGPERFGHAIGHLAVRLPILVQPALPRFVRPGDAFTAVAIGRVVEGKGGPGSAEMRATGVRVTGPSRHELTWVEARPERIEFPVEVLTPSYTAEGTLAASQVGFRVGVERAADRARDAFEVNLPIRDDRERVTLRLMQDLTPGVALDLPAVTEKVRAGTFKRSVLVSDQPGLVRMAAGLDFLLAYPHGCTEQQLSRARAYVALKKFRTLLRQSGSDAEIARAVRSTLELIPTVVDPNGLTAYWPGGDGRVSLTAWVVQFMVEAKEAGFSVDQALLERLLRSLEQALRSDYSRFIDGEAFLERAWALAALAQAGRFDAAYAAELARKAQYLDLEGVAQVLQSFAQAKQGGAAADQLMQSLVDGVIVRLHQGREIYGGLQEGRSSRSGLILPSETRTVAEITRALAQWQPKNPRLPILTNALVTLGRDDGWGTTNANAAALLALSQLLQPPFAGSSPHTVHLAAGGRDQTIATGPEAPLGSAVLTDPGAGQLRLMPGGSGTVVARVETSYVPAADGSQVAARSSGFVVSRELLRVRKEGEPVERIPLAQAGTTQSLASGDVVEDHVQVVNPKERHYVAVVVPLAAGMEPLNPRLATAPPESRPAGRVTREATHVAYLDDQVAFYYDTLPAGTYDFYFRTRATTAGSYVQPAAKAEMMYDGAVAGNSNGARIVVAPAPRDGGRKE